MRQSVFSELQRLYNEDLRTLCEIFGYMGYHISRGAGGETATERQPMQVTQDGRVLSIGAMAKDLSQASRLSELPELEVVGVVDHQ